MAIDDDDVIIIEDLSTEPAVNHTPRFQAPAPPEQRFGVTLVIDDHNVDIELSQLRTFFNYVIIIFNRYQDEQAQVKDGPPADKKISLEMQETIIRRLKSIFIANPDGVRESVLPSAFDIEQCTFTGQYEYSIWLDGLRSKVNHAFRPFGLSLEALTHEYEMRNTLSKLNTFCH